MKFSSHLGKGAWAFASRGLPFAYAVVIIAIANALPKEEFGLLSLFQAVFAMIFTFADSFALQAIVKFGVEPDIELQRLFSTIASVFIGFLIVLGLIGLLLSQSIAQILNVPQFADLLPWLIALAFLTVPRVMYSKILQMQYRMKELFWVDFSNFGVSSIVLTVLLLLHKVHSATDVVQVTVASAFLSSLVALIFGRNSATFKFGFYSPLFHKVWDFVKFQGATGVVAVLQQQFDVLLVSSFTGAPGVANYQAAKNIYRGFDAVRDTSALFVFPSSSKYYSRGDLSTLGTILEKAIGFLYLLLVPIGAILFIVAPILFHLIWGTKYDESIPILRVLLIGVLALPLQIVLPPALAGMGKVQPYFKLLSVSAATNVLVSLVLLPIIGSIGAAISFVVGIFIIAILSYFTIRKEIPLHLGNILSRGLRDSLNFVKELRSRSSH